MLVDADGVEAHGRRIFELVHELVIDAMADFGIEERARDIPPQGIVPLPEILRQFRIRHEMEPHELHGGLLRCPPACSREMGGSATGPAHGCITMVRPSTGSG